jgi:uncharacterized protein with PIN domain
MVLDTSAIIAEIFGEPERQALINVLTTPLLFKGGDVSKIDIVPAWRP